MTKHSTTMKIKVWQSQKKNSTKEDAAALSFFLKCAAASPYEQVRLSR